MKVGDLVRVKGAAARYGDRLYIVSEVAGRTCQLFGVRGYFSIKDGLEIISESR